MSHLNRVSWLCLSLFARLMLDEASEATRRSVVESLLFERATVERN